MGVQRVRRSGKGPILLLPTMPVVNFTATPETCSGEAGEAAGQGVDLSPTLTGTQGQQGRDPGSRPQVGPQVGSLGTQAGGSEAQAPMRWREGASLAASPRELDPRGRRGRRKPAAEGSPAGRPRPTAPPRTLSSPYTPKYSSNPSAGKPFQRRNGALRWGHPRLGRPRRVNLFWGYPHRRPFSSLLAGTGWVPSLRRNWVGVESM